MSRKNHITSVAIGVLVVSLSLGYSKTIEIKSSGHSFVPKVINITTKDSVEFVLARSHNAVEISKATYDAGKRTPLSGGFKVPFGGGTIGGIPGGTHYYTCTNHANMKGVIVVSNTTGIKPGNTYDDSNTPLKILIFDAAGRLREEKTTASEIFSVRELNKSALQSQPSGPYYMHGWTKKGMNSYSIV